MYGFLKFKQKSLFFISSFFLISSIYPKEVQDSKSKMQTSYVTTMERTFFKSIIETLWTVFKENHQKTLNNKGKNKRHLIDYYELGKIYSDLVIDELIPRQKNNFKQKIIELLTPTATAFLINAAINQKKELDYTKLTSDLFVKLLCKLIMVRWFQTPGTPSHRIVNDLALLGTFYKFDKNKIGIFKYVSIYNAAEKIPLDALRTFIQSNKVDFGPFFNKKHRKKAIAKTAQVLGLPIIQYLLNNIATLLTTEQQ